MSVSLLVCFFTIIQPNQVPVPAGHEFIVSTDAKYSESGDEKVMFVDYVRKDPSSTSFPLF